MPIIDPFISQKSDIIDPFQSATSAEISPPSLIGGISPTSYTGAFLTGVGAGAKETLSIPERIAYKVNQALARQGIGYVPVEEKPKSWMETPSWAAETFGGITGVTPEAERAAAEAHPIVTGLGQLAEAIPEFMIGGGVVTKGARALGLLSKFGKTGKVIEKIGALERAGQKIRKAIGIPAELLPKVAIEVPTFAAIEGLKHGQPIEGAIMGAAFPLTQIPSKLAYRILAGAGAMGGLTAIEGGTKEDIAYSAVLGGLFNTLSKSLQKDLLREMRGKPDVKVGDLNAAKSEEFQQKMLAVGQEQKALPRGALITEPPPGDTKPIVTPISKQQKGVRIWPQEGYIEPTPIDLTSPYPPELPAGKKTLVLPAGRGEAQVIDKQGRLLKFNTETGKVEGMPAEIAGEKIKRLAPSLTDGTSVFETESGRFLTADGKEVIAEKLPKGMPEQPISPFAKELQRPAMPDSVKINDITKGEAIDRLVNGDPTVIPHIEEAVGKFGSAAMTDELLNGAIAKAAKDKKLTNFRKVEPDLKIALQGEEARIAARDKALFEQTRTETADERQRRAIGEDLIALAREKRKAKPLTLTPEEAVIDSNIIQKQIDVLENKYIEQGIDIFKTYDASINKASDLPSDYKPMPEDLAKLYRERNISLDKETNDFIDNTIKNSGLSIKDAEKGLSAVYIKKEGLVSSMQQSLKNWGVYSIGGNDTLNNIYNSFKEESMPHLEFNVGGTPDNPRLVVRSLEGKLLVDKEALKKTEKLYNAVAKNTDKGEINLNLKELTKPALVEGEGLKSKFILEQQPATKPLTLTPEEAIMPKPAPEGKPAAVKGEGVKPKEAWASLSINEQKNITGLDEKIKTHPYFNKLKKIVDTKWQQSQGKGKIYDSESNAYLTADYPEAKQIQDKIAKDLGVNLLGKQTGARMLDIPEPATVGEKAQGKLEIAAKPIEAEGKAITPQEAWEMTRDAFDKSLSEKRYSETIPIEEKPMLAVKAEGKIYTDPQAKLHADIMDKIPNSVDLSGLETGWIINGKFEYQIPKVHKQLVQQALSEGKPVKAEILKDYPDLQKPSAVEKPLTGEKAAPKEAWEMTRKEYTGEKPRDFTPEMNMYQARYATHGYDVMNALEAGKPVPAKVLKDYPDLQKPAAVEKPLPTEKGKPQIGSKIYEKASGGEKAQTHTIEKITPSTEAGVEPTVEFKNDKTGDISETDLSKLIPITKGKGKGGFTTSFLGTQQAYEALASMSKPTYDTAKTHLHDIGGSLYKEGMKYADFAKGMKSALGTLWDKFKQMIGRVYFGVKKAYKESRLGSEKGLAGYDIGEGKPKPEPPKGAVTEPVSPVKEKVQTTYEIINEPVNSSTPDNVKQYIGNAKQQLDGFWNNVKTFFDQFRQIGEYQLPKGMLKQYPEKTRLKIQDYINAKIGKEELVGISPEHFRMIDNVKSRQEFEYKRGKGRGKEDRIEVLVKRLYDKLKIFPDDVRKNIQSYLGGKLSLQDLPEEARGIAYSIRERTITLGKMAVKAGTLDPKVFEANKGTWVHYIYAKHILGEEPVFKAGGVGMDLGYTIGRMDAVIKDLGDETYQVVSKGGKQYTKAGLTLKEAQKEQVRIQKDVDYKRKELGHIEDAAMSVPVGWGKVLTDIARAERFKQIVEDPNIVWQPSRLKIDGKPITIGDLAEEWQTFKAMVDRGGATPETIARYGKLSTALLEAQETAKQVPAGFVQMPTGKRWGDMSGAFVKKAVYNDLMPLYKSTSQEVGSLYKTIADIEAKGMAWFKVGKVALNPPTAFRNMVSMVLQSVLRPEGKMFNIIPYYIKSAQEHLNNGRFYTMAKRDGNFSSNFTQGELREILDEFINAQKKGGSFVTILNTIGKLAKYYGKIDDIGKLAIYMESLDSGMSRARATMEAQKWGMDYSVTSPSVKMLRKHVVPFLTYQYKIAPLLLESMKSKPWVLGSLAIAAPLLVQETVKNMAGITPREWDKLKKDLPDYISKNKNYMMLPFKSPEGNWQWVNMEYFLPWGNFMGIARDLKHGDMGELTRDMGIGNPFLDLLSMAKSASSGRPPIDPFTRQPVYSQLDSPAIQWAKLSAFLWNKWAPSIVGIDIGKTGFGAAQLTMNIGEQDKWGRTITPAQAAGRWFGVNIVTTSPQQTMRIKQAKIRELEAERSRLMRDRSITPEQRMGIQRRFIEQVRGVLERNK